MGVSIRCFRALESTGRGGAFVQTSVAIWIG